MNQNSRLKQSFVSYKRWKFIFNCVMVLAVITFISSSVYFISSSHSSQSPRARPSLVKHPQKAVGNLEKFNKKIYETEKNNDNNEDENGDLNDDDLLADIQVDDPKDLYDKKFASRDDNNNNNNNNNYEEIQNGNIFASADVEKQQAIKEAFQFAWDQYSNNAFGFDEIKPVDGQPSNDWGGLAATLVDSLDTLWLMGMKKEFKAARDWVAEHFHPKESNWNGSLFEVTIRYLGGLLAAFELSGDRMFVDKAEELAEALMPAFNTPSGIPKTTINLKTGRATNPSWNGQQCVLSEFGTLGLEWRALSHYTGNEIYRDKVDLVAEKMRDVTTTGLLPTFFNADTGQPTNSHITYGARGDSYYEYLVKQWIQSGKTDYLMKATFDLAVNDTLNRLIQRSTPSNLAYVAEMQNHRTNPKMDELVCFIGGMFVLSGDDKLLPLAEDITHTCWLMFNTTATGLAPEIVEFQPGADFHIRAAHNLLRPETIESMFYLWRKTKKPKYRERAWRIFQSWMTHSKSEYGFSGIHDVDQLPPSKNNRQESFFFAETLKYLYLIFSDDSKLDLSEFVFNTEAHPMRIRK